MKKRTNHEKYENMITRTIACEYLINDVFSYNNIKIKKSELKMMIKL